MKYRIVEDRFENYEVQKYYKFLWWGYWKMVRVNTHKTIEQAKQFIEEEKGNYIVVYSD